MKDDRPERRSDTAQREAEDQSDANDLATRVQALPRELWDIVFGYVFPVDHCRSATNAWIGPLCPRIMDSNAGILVTATYRLPMRLQTPQRKPQLRTFSQRPRHSETPDLLPSRRARRPYIGRDQFARSYYSETLFTFTSRALLRRWLRSLPLHHSQHLREVRVEFPLDAEGHTPDSWNEAILVELDLLWDELEDSNIFPPMMEVFYVRLWCYSCQHFHWFNGR